MRRLGIILATISLSFAAPAAAQTVDFDRVAGDAARKATALYLHEGLAGLRDAFDGCMRDTARSKKAAAATSCAAMGWTMVYLDLLAVDALHIPPTIDVDGTSTRISAAMVAAGLTASDARRLRPFVVQFVDLGLQARPEPARAGGRT
ncbi:hypothetical protein PQI07_28285 [Methylobacterium sp. 092160098-2]|uniref:hypothetical protein n=1 Tax=Methylobacterium sp. 092160098-2 TaxID=3025129 RepID=UPI002381CF9F|nr:hypothetical protein [Methylobacterium sp. 092160098-2]MDE4914569.1 hypothetical protein [Methylobacterium sp. 092160098-2]